MRAFTFLLGAFAAMLCVAPASAELYKWVDERGVTNYSGDPPPPAATANKLSRVENKISVYTPDDGVLLAVKAVRERAIKALTEPEPARSPVVRIAVEQSGYEQCISSGRIGCEDLYPAYYPAAYLPVRGYPLRRIPPPRVLPPRPVPHDPTRVSRGPLR
ncbi:MAG: DUF4124 domain-containing protein [Betaproteobacteria bacterium]